MSKLVTRSDELYPTSPRNVLRAAALSLLRRASHLGRNADEYLSRNRVQIVNLHNVFPDEEVSFRDLIARLSLRHSFVTYSEAVNRIWSGEIDRPYMTFSFDDGHKSCVRAAEILSGMGASACFFINPGIVGERDERKVEEYCRSQLLAPPMDFMDWYDVERLLLLGHEIGSHGMHHLKLSQVTPGQAESEIGESFAVIKSRTGSAKHHAWSYGHFEEFSPFAARCVFDVGHLSCASGVRGCHSVRGTGRELCLRRDHVIAKWPLAHVEYFLAHASAVSSQATNCWPTEWEMNKEPAQAR
jgi:peptidoglycan/xylan/chitin deacetylase (PgdA/CDA1 family)